MNFTKKIAFYTLGCKVNQYETESIKNQLLKKGYEEVSFEENSDFYIVNSCTVTSIADKKTRNILRRAKKINPNAKIILTGCYAQTNNNELDDIKEIDYIIDNKNKNNISNFLAIMENEDAEKLKYGNIFLEKEYQEYEFAPLKEMLRAYVKIQDGCNHFCSYCKIPYARGKSRSRKKENVINEIKKLVEEGFKEVILIGIDLTSYGEDFSENERLESLLEDILKIENLERVRIGSIYPDKITDRFIELFKNKKMMPHLHISLQSCDDTVLKNMRRKYGNDLIIKNLNKIKNLIPNMQLTADIIVGFPQETEEMFENSYKTIEKISFSNLHIFQYSDRGGTLASKMNGKINPMTKKERANKLEELKEKMFIENREKYLGKTLKILVEEEKDGYFYGYSENYIKVKFESVEKNILNNIVNIKIISVDKNIVIGEKE